MTDSHIQKKQLLAWIEILKSPGLLFRQWTIFFSKFKEIYVCIFSKKSAGGSQIPSNDYYGFYGIQLSAF